MARTPAAFVAERPVLLRTPLLPVRAAELTRVAVAPGQPAYHDELRRLLKNILANPLFREALAVASGDLHARVSTVDPAALPDGDDLERLTLSCVRYFLRMTSRATPFGLFAGVSLLRGDPDRPVVRGTGHRRWVQVDHEWLDNVVTALVERPEVRRGLRYRFTDLATRRGGRVQGPPVPAPDATGPPDPGARRAVTVRDTEAVRLVQRVAATPVRYADLLDALRHRFPTASTERLEGALDGLRRAGLLLHSLRPRVDEADPLGHVVGTVEAVAPALAEPLRAVARAADRYRDCDLGDGLAPLEALWQAMDRVQPPAGRPQVQVDLVLDHTGNLPECVRREAASAATALWRLSPQLADQAALDRYRDRFIDRYGVHHLVPLAEVVDPVDGIGYPDGYHGEDPPPADRPASAAAGDAERLLSDLTYEALAGHDELVITDDLLDRLAPEPPPPPPPSLDLGTHIIAASAADLSAGRFRLWLSGLVAFEQGAVAGRFLPALGADADTLTVLGLAATGADDTVPAQLVFEPPHAKTKNVQRSVRLGGKQVSVGVFGPVCPGELDSSGLWLTATHERLVPYVRGPADERWREVVIRNPSMLEMARYGPPVPRLLATLARAGTRVVTAWYWNRLGLLSHLPRVRYGRTVLSAARWRPPVSLVGPNASTAGWAERFQTWRHRLGVPDLVQLTVVDHRLDLDLRVPLHVELVRRELVTHADADLVEPPDTGPSGSGWSGGYAAEAVVSLRRREQPSRLRAAGPPAARSRPVAYPPGSAWLYARVFTEPQAAPDLLADHLPPLLAKVAQHVRQWHFLRYTDPRFHLRLRFHGEPEALTADVLPVLRQWYADLRETRLAGDFELGTYRPEVDRYGGASCLDAAHQLFAADSAACLGQLGMPAARQAQGEATFGPMLAALNHLAILQGCGVLDWPEWVVAQFPRDGRAPRDTGWSRARGWLRRAAAGDWAALPSDLGLSGAAFAARSAAARRYHATLTEAVPDAPHRRAEAIRSVLHMSHNRVCGVDPVSESHSLWLMRDAALSICRRKGR